MNDPQEPAPDERVHSEAPAEGDESQDPTDTRSRAEEPAEGPDRGDEEKPAPDTGS
ncbi:hypothetical protein KIH31_15875 [Paenarthrobacter sp. DKR-5]|uniref:hypothetical protein n=1 Tax=Paenarthrobacter sp. DKR-5 TaxID=2835535 RepID=UPI001BDDB75E|nr:hypothetical protein [Paenarthrobacter sp. DKR-5]MBT1004066.1 hypothetical protein [Paenarthrobacter sp. DKR-5]